MPAQKRGMSANLDVDDDESPPPRYPQLRRKRQRHDHDGEPAEAAEAAEAEEQANTDDKYDDDDEEDAEEENEVEEAEDAEVKEEDEEEDVEEDGDDAQKEDSDGTPSSSDEEKPEFILVELPNIRKDVQCPICLGIIKKTRTVMECLHRFCRECIDKSMRMGNNECPACRTHCPSRRSLRDDPNYDALIAALYPDIEKYEAEELAFHEEEKNRNKQIQESIARVFQRQEALNKRRSMGKDTTGAYVTRSQRNSRNAHTRRRRNTRGYEQGSDENEDDNDNDLGKNSSSTDERCVEVKPRRGRKRRRSLPSSSAANSDGGCFENDVELRRERRGISPGIVWNPDMFAWGRGGTRSHTRHGSASGSSSRSARNSRLTKLVDYLRSLDSNDDELDVHLMLVSLDKQSTPSLHQPYLCCRPSLSVRHLREYVALQTPLEAEEVEMLVVNGNCKTTESHPVQFPSTCGDNHPAPEVAEPCKDELQILQGQETIAGLKASCSPSRDHLIIVYRKKENLANS